MFRCLLANCITDDIFVYYSAYPLSVVVDERVPTLFHVRVFSAPAGAADDQPSPLIAWTVPYPVEVREQKQMTWQEVQHEWRHPPFGVLGLPTTPPNEISHFELEPPAAPRKTRRRRRSEVELLQGESVPPSHRNTPNTLRRRLKFEESFSDQHPSIFQWLPKLYTPRPDSSNK